MASRIYSDNMGPLRSRYREMLTPDDDAAIRAQKKRMDGVDALIKANGKRPEYRTRKDGVTQRYHVRHENKSTSGRKAQYKRDKNAGQTELNYRQWAQVRTPEFKKWFGYDWQKRQSKKEKNTGRNTGITSGAGAGISGAAGRVRRPEGRGSRRDHTASQADWNLSATGEPRIWYHGTRGDFRKFDLNHPDRKDVGWLGRGAYVVSSEPVASAYARMKRGSEGPHVMPLFLSIRNPYMADKAFKKVLSRSTQQQVDELTENLKEQGYDGVVLRYPNGETEAVAFGSSQVKSAISNNGDFSRQNEDITKAFSMPVLFLSQESDDQPIGETNEIR